MSFEQVAPGILVNTDKVEFGLDFVDPCHVVYNLDATQAIANQEGRLLIFSTREKAEYFIEKVRLENHTSVEFSWDYLVESFSRQCSYALVDHEGEPGFYRTVALRS